MAITAAESTGTVTLTIDGREVTAPEGETIWQAAKAVGIDIPVLCHDERFDPVGVCRMCVVDVGAPAFAASCVRACENGMQVKTDTPELERNRAMLTKLLVSDQPPRERDPKQITTGDNELLPAVRFRPRRRPVQPGHRGRPRRLHPLRPVHPGV
jgi:formate dehydrogenase major subunit